ncbi:flavocytochrome c [Treponema maltophilum ATCC 51939]|uniref:Urocanate reductase n=1 Tax=Treponema maltophilum ATCC 51939 TaxID=1125699 RepID=S3L556_TREMA|nr:flavocytochrome c [Treponema maltophilum]EPF31929.1 flavocytochrome c [Treponema maltophilum ATCC 51939]
MKKVVTGLFAAIFVSAVLFTACSKGSSMKNGTYTGTGEGKGGKITVEVTVKKDAIADIKVISHNETPGFDKAMDTLKAAVIKSNSTAVDTVSGCTLTSKGFLQAVNAAVAQAGGELKANKKDAAASQAKQDKTETHDVIIIGAGGAGLAAAIEAKEAGADVIVLEKMPMAGGNTLISGAEMAAPGNWLQKRDGIEDSVARFEQDIMKGGDNISNPELVHVVASNALAGAEWLRDNCGVVWENSLMFFGGHSVKRSLIPAGASGKELITKMLAKAEKLGITIVYNTPAVAFIQDAQGRVTGVSAESETTKYTFYAKKGVVLATGGFGSNLDMRKKYNPAVDENILSTNTVGSTGDGIVMSEKIGAALVDMQYIQTYPICDPLTGTLLYFDDARLYGHSVIVNKEGKRFVEELGRRDVMSMAIKAQAGHCCYEIIDQKGYEESHLEQNHAAEIDYLYKNKLLVKADTLEKAAAFFGIDAKEMIATVNRYNSYVAQGKDPEFNKRSLTFPIEKAPFYILKAVPAVHHTMGGVKINSQAQVIKTDGTVIPGLYAAGEVTGGVHGKNRLGSDAIADIIVFGRIAGKNVAK